jgi:DNA-binding SARP family transcriptional activator
MTILRVAVLGSVVAHVGDRTVPVTSAKQAAVLACLALQAPRLTGVSTLIDAIWGDDPPNRAEQALQQHVSTLRGLLEPGRAPRTESTVLLTEANGYRLAAVDLDVAAFLDLADRGERAAMAARWPEALRAIDAALACWRGPALAGVPETPWFRAHQVRLSERRLAVVEARLSALLGLGQYGPLISDCEELLAREPLREDVWAHLITGLARSGRTADALAAYSRARRILRTELGLEPGAALRQLERDIFSQTTTVKDATPIPDPDLELASTFQAVVGQNVPWVQLPDGQVVALTPGIHRVGRHPEAVVRLSDSRVSRWHAEFEHRTDGVHLHDLGSTNGTTINGRSIATGVLAEGDVVGIGGVTLVFHA